MRSNLLRLAGFIVLVALLFGFAAADWVPSDGHKMHFPQLPDEAGWDVNATQPLILADDWQCSETGWVKDVHFWGSWKHGVTGQVTSFVLSIHSDIPADQSPTGYSMPGETLWEREITEFVAQPIDPPSMEGWYDPLTGEVLWDDHQAYFQYNVFLPEADWFWQEEGTIYWLNISAIVADPVNTQWGWKSTLDHWNDDAVWAQWGNLSWVDLWEPEMPLHNEFWITIAPDGSYLGGGGTDPFGQGWYFYPEEGWWNIWFYDHPFDPERKKEFHLEFDVFKLDPALESYVEVAINWSTPEWSLEGNVDPPLPGMDETLYIGRHTVIAGPDLEGRFAFDFTLPDYNPEWVSVDVRGYNFEIPMGSSFLDHTCMGSLDLSFVITGGPPEPPDTCDYYKRPYPDYSPQGMPDFDMKQSTWTDQTGNWSHDGPAALANCIWWFDSKFEPNPVDPRPFGVTPPNDNYRLVMSYGTWDDHDTMNVQPLITDLANNYVGTNPGGSGGTPIWQMQTGFQNWVAAQGLTGYYQDTLVSGPSWEYISSQVLDCQDVILQFGFYEDVGTSVLSYIGSHYVTTAGVCTDQTLRQICISDPYLDALEGEPPAGSSHGGTVHNDADNISGPHGQIQHDPYQCVLTTLPGFTQPVEVVNYRVDGTLLGNFAGMNGFRDFAPWAGGTVYTVIEAALVICPDTPPPDTCEYYKLPYEDYAPYGMPDFDQKQDNWVDPANGMWSHCGPVALSNCFWWFDSKFEPNPIDPRPFYPGPGNPLKNDGYPLVPSFDPLGRWDDHDTTNVMPLVDTLAKYSLTNTTGSGTLIWDLEHGARSWLDSVGLLSSYTTVVVPLDPAFPYEFLRDEVLASQDVILLIGFWEEVDEGYCERIGGHYVTVAGTCPDQVDSAFCISDPYFDKNEGEPPAGSAHGSSVHNDAANVSGPHGTIHHDRYDVVPTTCLNFAGGPLFQLEFANYPTNPSDIGIFHNQNAFDPTVPMMPPQGGFVHAVLEFALIICPVPPQGIDTVKCEPQGGTNPSHPSNYWFDVTPGSALGLYDFHVKTLDSMPHYYTAFYGPAGWSQTLHKVGSDWWVSWWDPTGTNPISSTTRFGFDNWNPSIWSDWVTTTSAGSDPTVGQSDRSGNHSSDPDGYGYRVHVPYICCVLRGDITHDGTIAVSDLTFLIAYLFRGGPAPFCPAEADMVVDGAIKVSDLTYLIAYLFRGGPAPPPCP